MSIISSAAHFQYCGCRKHGRIVTAGGMRGPEVGSKEVALEALRIGVEEKIIASDEAKIVRQQIEQSPLPNPEIGLTPLMWLCEEIEKAMEREAWGKDDPNEPSPTIH